MKQSIVFAAGCVRRALLAAAAGFVWVSLVPSDVLKAHGGAEEPVVHLDPVVVTGTRTERLLGEAPIRTELIVAPEIQRQGARTFADAMEYVPGVQVESNCQTCNTSEIRLLGLDGSYNQLIFDGRPLFSALAGVYGVEQVPALFIDRIEVVKGGASALYGPSAVAGVVNVISRVPAASGVLAEYRFDAVKGVRGDLGSFVADYVAPGGGMDVTVYGQLARQDPVDFDGDGYSEIARRRLASAGVRFSREIGAGRFKLDYNRTQEARRGGNRFHVPPHLANIAEAIDTVRDAGGLEWAARPSADFDYRAGLAFAYTARESYYGGLGDLVAEVDAPGFDRYAYAEAAEANLASYGTTRNPLYSLETQFNRRGGAHLVSWGAQGEWESVDDRNPGSGNADLRARYSNAAVFVQDDWTLSSRWTLLSGLRLDKHSELSGAVLSPRAALKHAPNHNLAIRLAASTGFRAPRIFDEDLHVSTLGADPIRIVNRPGLRKEGARGVFLSATWNPPALAERLAFEAALFGTRLSDSFRLSEVRTGPGGDLYQERFNTTGAQVRGMELSAAWSVGTSLRIDASVVVQDLRLERPEVIFDDAEGRVVATDRFNKVPGRLGVVQVAYTPAGPWESFVGAKYLGAMDALNLNAGAFIRTPAFWVIDASLVRRFRWSGWELEVQAGIRNLTDDRQKDFESGPDRDSDYVYGPRTPRTWYLGVRSRI